MTKQEEIFERELNMIKNEALREFAKATLNKVDAYFFFCSSSSTGKYHSRQSNMVGNAETPGGLVNHTKGVMYFCDILCRAYDIVGKDRDLVLIAAQNHDSLKWGRPMQRYTVKDHAKLSANFVYSVYKQGDFPEVQQEDVITICNMINLHMGRWDSERHGKRFPDDYTNLEIILHSADMCSAGKEVSLDFIEEAFIG